MQATKLSTASAADADLENLTESQVNNTALQNAPNEVKQAAAADGKIEKGRHASHGQRPGEAFEFVELAGDVAAAYQRPDRRARDHRGCGAARFHALWR